MGNNASAASDGVSDAEIRKYELDSFFSVKEVKRLNANFNALQPSATGSIRTDAFIAQPELAFRPLLPSVVRSFESEPGYLNFKEYISAAELLSSRTPLSKKAEKVFGALEALDGRNDRGISIDGLLVLFRQMFPFQSNAESQELASGCVYLFLSELVRSFNAIACCRIMDDFAIDGRIARGSMDMLLDSSDLSQLVINL
jgi:Ca2+-binding EF-hand superfamily protein